MLSKKQILDEIEKFKVDEIPENLIIEEVKVLSQGMSDEEAKKNNVEIMEGFILNFIWLI